MPEGLLNDFVIDDTNYQTNYTKKFLMRKKYVSTDPSKLFALIPGTIRQIFIKKGDTVKKGDSMMILEAMKMKNDLKSPHNATIKNLSVKTGDTVIKGQLLIEFGDIKK